MVVARRLRSEDATMPSNPRPRLPALPLAPELRGAEFGSFAHQTIVRRLPGIARRVLEQQALPGEASPRLKALIADIPTSPLRLLRDLDAPDAPAWRACLAPHLGQDWLTPPWLVVEFYFFRRVLEASGFYEPGPGKGLDPYRMEKRAGLEAGLATLEKMSAQVGAWIEAHTWEPGALLELLSVDLWGNQADLSLFPAQGGEQPAHRGAQQRRSHTLVDDTERVIRHLAAAGGRPLKVEMILDNTGLELAGDLWLADYLLGVGLAAQVRLHLKMHPTYVSDATRLDVRRALAYYQSGSDAGMQAHARRLQRLLEGGRLVLQDHPSWTLPLSFWELPGDLWEQFARADLVISKGDANYRRLLGDRQWPFTTRFEEIVSYFPTPLLALCTLKSELACGLEPEQLDHLAQVDEDWLTSGRWGVIQFYNPQ